MIDTEIDAMIRRIDKMARVIGCRFVPDPEKLLAFRCAQREHEAMHAEYRRQMRELQSR